MKDSFSGELKAERQESRKEVALGGRRAEGERECCSHFSFLSGNYRVGCSGLGLLHPQGGSQEV